MRYQVGEAEMEEGEGEGEGKGEACRNGGRGIGKSDCDIVK